MEMTQDRENFLVLEETFSKEAKDAVPDEETLYELAELFSVFSDSTRIRILYALSVTQMCVQDLAKLLNMSQPAISHQLKILRQSRLVFGKREGKMVFYSLADSHVSAILEQGINHVME